MAENSKIQWTTHTFNPWRGCTKVSPGCLNCYAEKVVVNRLGGAWGKGAPRQLAKPSTWAEPLAWDRKAAQVQACVKRFATALRDDENHDLEIRPRVFCASLADWLDEEVPAVWLRDLMDLVARTPHLDWLLLTKRPKNWQRRITEASSIATNGQKPEAGQALMEAWITGTPPANVWVGTSVEDQQRANERIPALLKIPARVRFLSCEPLLGPVDLELAHKSWTGLPGIDWVIVGGESGPGARETNIEHIFALVDQCNEEVIPVFVKQLGALPVTTNTNLYDWPEGALLKAHGEGFSAAAVILTDKKGGDIAEWPEQLQVRQFPQP